MSELSVLNAMNYASANAGGFVTMANTALAAASRQVLSISYDGVHFNPIPPPQPPKTDNVPTVPSIEPPTLNLPGDPSAPPAPTTPSPIDAGQAPTDSSVLPVLRFPSTPSQIGASPSAPPINTSFVFPDPPAALTSGLPSAPIFKDRTEPDSPEIILPEFLAMLPASVADAPTNGAQIMEAAFRAQSLNSQTNADAYVDAQLTKFNPRYREQMGRIEDQLATYLAGGTGLKPAIEDAIYSRARQRNDEEAQRVRDTAYADAAQRGFTIPDGALMAAVARARQAGANNNLKASSDIVVMQAEMEQKNLQFAVTTSTGLRTAMVSAAMSYMGHVVSINGQAMDYAKSAFANIVELYNASVRVYSARVDAYRSYASVYESQIKAALAKLDVYRAKIAALEAMTNVDRSRADIYRAQIEATTSLVGLYRAQIEAVMGRVTLEKTKLDIFQAQVQAFGAQVQAKNAEWSGYNAALSGEESKVKIFNAQISAFGSRIEAYKALITAKTAESDAIVKTNQAQAQTYSTAMQGFQARVGAESERSRAHNENNKAVLTAFDRDISAFMAQTNLKLAQYKAENEAKVQNATGDLTGQVESARAKSQHGESLARISIAGAQIYGQLASSAMAGMNTLAADVNNT